MSSTTSQSTETSSCTARRTCSSKAATRSRSSWPFPGVSSPQRAQRTQRSKNEPSDPDDDVVDKKIHAIGTVDFRAFVHHGERQLPDRLALAPVRATDIPGTLTRAAHHR